MQVTSDVIQKIENQRKRYGFSVQVLCQEAKTNRTTYERMLRRETSPRGTTLDSFIEALDRLRGDRA